MTQRFQKFDAEWPADDTSPRGILYRTLLDAVVDEPDYADMREWVNHQLANLAALGYEIVSKAA